MMSAQVVSKPWRPKSIRRLGPLLLVLLAALLASACTSFGPGGPAEVEMLESGGFRITEEARFGLGTRSDFREAMGLLEDERYDEGVDLLVALTEVAPHAIAAQINLGIAYAKIDELDQAADSLERALALNPQHPAAHNELGIVRRRQGRFEEARTHYEAALEFYPGFHLALRNLAILCDMYLSDSDCAIDYYERYAAAVPEDQKVSMWIADLRSRVGE